MVKLDVLRRLYTTVLGITTLILCTFSSIEFTILFVVIWILCFKEYFHITSLLISREWKPKHTLTVAVVSVVLVSIVTGIILCIPKLSNLFGVGLIIAWIIAVLQLTRYPRTKSLIQGSLYLSIPFLFAIVIRWQFDWTYTLLMFVGIWSMDVFSYITGMLLGRHYVVPKISPKKTWEGLIGGIIGSMICFLLFQQSVPNMKPITITTVLFAVLLPILSFFGDIFESSIKRLVGCKDSSQILDGHGGLWDRFDSMLFYTIGYIVFLGLIHL